MGQKVNPHGLRVGVISDWDSNWFAEDKFADYLVEDYKIREFVKKKLYSAGISKIEIERPTDKVRVIIHTLCACLHRSAHCRLHCTTEGDTILKLLRNILCY